jgi:hypothetical protein
MKGLINLSFAAIWLLWIGGGIWTYVAGEPSLLGIVALPAKSNKPALAGAMLSNAPLLAKDAPAGAAPVAPAPHILSNVQDCTAVTPIDRSAGSACDPHKAKGAVMAPAVFREREAN